MKCGILVLLTFLTISVPAFGQITEEELIGTWFPVMQQFEDGDTSYYDTNFPIFIFEKNGKGKHEIPGNNPISFPFTYKVLNDSIQISSKKEITSLRITRTSNFGLKIFFKPMSIVTFIRLPEIDLNLGLKELKSTITGNIWEFFLDGLHEFPILYEFDSQLNDSSMVGRDFHSTTFSVRAYLDGLHGNDEENFWAIAEHGTTQVLRINHIFSFLGSKVLLLEKYEKDQLEFSFWDHGEKHELIAKTKEKSNPRSLQRNFKLLTQTKWQFFSEYIPPVDTTGLMDLGMVADDFEELDNQYKHDSSAVIWQSDLDLKLLMLEFHQNGTYKISRQDRVLDQGTWRYFFDHTVVKLTSSKERHKSDGIFGGDIKIESIKQNRLKLYRNLDEYLGHANYGSYSHLETYKPYRKRN